MRTIAIYLTVSWCFATLAYTQDAAQHQNRAASLLLNGKPEAAIEELQTAADLYASEKKWVYYFNCLNELTEAYLATAQHLKAKRTAKRALWKCINILGRDKEEAAKAAHQLAEVYAASHRYADALTYHKMGLDIRESINGRLHPGVAASLRQIANIHQAAGDVEMAKTDLTEALSIIEDRYHRQHPEVAPLLVQMGNLHKQEEQRAAARKTYERAIRILRAEGSSDKHLLSQALCQLAAISAQQKRMELYREALPHLQSCDEGPSPSAAMAFHHLGAEALEEGKTVEGLRLLQKAMAYAEAVPEAVEAAKSTKLLLADWKRINGDLPEAAAMYNDLGEGYGGLPPLHQLLAGEVALATHRPEAAACWAGLSQDEIGPDAMLSAELRLLRARAAHELGEYETARALTDRLLSSPFPAIAARACLISGEVSLSERAPDQALKALLEGLAKCPGHRVFLLFQLHQLAALAYTDLAAQSPQQLGLLRDAKQQLDYCNTYLDEAIFRPLLLRERYWLSKYQRLTAEAALDVSYLMYRQSGAEHDLDLAFRQLEQTQKVEQWLAMGPAEFAPLYQQALFRRNNNRMSALRNGVGPGHYTAAGYNSDFWQDALGAGESRRYEKLPEEGLQRAEFQKLLQRCRAQSLHYFVGRQHLFILHLRPERVEMLRRPLFGDEHEQLQRMASCTQMEALLKMGREAGEILLPPIEANGRAKRLLIVPDAALGLFPFAALSRPEGDPIGSSFEIYRHTSASGFWQDYYSSKQLPGRKAGRVALEKRDEQWAAGAPTLMTGDFQRLGGPDWFRDWIVNGGGQAWAELACPDGIQCKLALLSLPSMEMDTLLRCWPREGLSSRRIVMPAPSTADSHAGRLLFSFGALQNRGAGNMLLYQQNSITAEDLAATTKGWENRGNFAQSLHQLRSGTSGGAANTAVGLWHMQVFGSPQRPAMAVGNIPAAWILAVVALLILIGWWVKRG